ncbi:dCMP deaminase [Mytilus galloprovincialis]|uniref:dCMP deaminase n=1 Tax=Mytilus galloprovincialis TaxID=29158 RepID=A0A8B6HTK2_MYTGA|nr:dCMP deaminase [Mytilus galloprovincialis]
MSSANNISDDFKEKCEITGVKNAKRENYLDWPDYFMAIAFLSAQRSKDPRTQVGACIVNEENKIVGIGYNGMPIGCHDDLMPWGREHSDVLQTKQLYVCHAELNAVLNKNSSDVKNCTIYVALFPCNECAKVVIQSGIKQVVYYSDKYHEKPEFIASRKMMDMAGVKYRQHIPKKTQILIDFSVIENMTQEVKDVLNKESD